MSGADEMSRRRSGCFGPSRYLVSGVLIGSSFETPWGARKNEAVISNILQRNLAFTNRISTALAQALPYSFFFAAKTDWAASAQGCFGLEARATKSEFARWLAQTWKQICLALLLLRPLPSARAWSTHAPLSRMQWRSATLAARSSNRPSSPSAPRPRTPARSANDRRRRDPARRGAGGKQREPFKHALTAARGNSRPSSVLALPARNTQISWWLALELALALVEPMFARPWVMIRPSTSVLALPAWSTQISWWLALELALRARGAVHGIARQGSSSGSGSPKRRATRRLDQSRKLPKSSSVAAVAAMGSWHLLG